MLISNYYFLQMKKLVLQKLSFMEDHHALDIFYERKTEIRNHQTRNFNNENTSDKAV